MRLDVVCQLLVLLVQRLRGRHVLGGGLLRELLPDFLFTI